MTMKPTTFRDSEAAKKPYETPRLETYGDIREIAGSVGSMNMNDGASHGNTKTS